MDGTEDIRDADCVTMPIQSCCINWKSITRTQKTANVSIVCKRHPNLFISIIVMIQTNSGRGHVPHAIWCDDDPGENGISQIKVKCQQRLPYYQPKSKRIPVSKVSIPLHQSVRFVPSRMDRVVQERASSCSNWSWTFTRVALSEFTSGVLASTSTTFGILSKSTLKKTRA